MNSTLCCGRDGELEDGKMLSKEDCMDRRRAGIRALLLLLVIIPGCHSQDQPGSCRIEGPRQLLPEEVERIHLGMDKVDLEALLGQPDYSPVGGQYYFSTGGACPLDEERSAPCGVVADFRNYTGGESLLMDSLQSCWWGAIAE